MTFKAEKLPNAGAITQIIQQHDRVCYCNTQVRHKSAFKPHYTVRTVAVEEAFK